MSKLRQLHTIFTPKTYNLHLTLHRAERRFEGTVQIKGITPQATEALVLHAKELEITQATINDQPATWQKGQLDELSLSTGNTFQPGEYKLEITFSGAITDPMNGLYPCYFELDGKNEELLATQFESHHAREVFPCIDEPAAKAKFDLTLTTEDEVTVISNTPVKSQANRDGWLITSFEQTPIMSTYLLAWIVGKLDYLEAKTAAGVTVRTYATPGKAEKTRFALETAVKTLDFYNQYFNIDYPLAKCDHVALPDFSSGAMENWGCITYRESTLLVDEHAAASTKQHVAMVVAHELAHQWFGNLVTMQWWNDLWLNESFASWIEYLALDKLHPEWHMWTQFYDGETAHALDRDALANVQKVRQDVSDPEEIRTLFDPAIVYAKGASLLHMLHAYLGAEAFRDGLRVYLKRHQYANAEADDLWAALSEVSNKNVATFMQPWISQPGHPVLKVVLDGNNVTLQQQRFYSNPKEAKPDDTTVWPLPLHTQGALPEDLLRETSLITETTSQPLILNQSRTGFYLTSYEKDHLALLANLVRNGKLGTTDRLGLLSEAYDLAKAGQQSTQQMLTLLEAYQEESSEPVWGAIASAISALRLLINEDPTLKPALQQFTATLTAQQFERLGWERKPGEIYFDELLRPTIVALRCYSEAPGVVEHAQLLFDNTENPEHILGDIRASVLATNAKFGGQPAFDKLMAWYKQTTSAEIRTQLTAGLAATKNPEHIEQLLAMLTTKAVKLQDIFYWFVYLIRSHSARSQTWQWMQENWSWIEKNFGSDMHYGDFPRYAATAFSTQEELEAYRSYFEPFINNPALARDIKQGLEAIEARVLWRQRDLNEVAAYLQAFAPEPEQNGMRL